MKIKPIWYKVETEGLPKKNGKYLCITKWGKYIFVKECIFALDLSKASDDFCEEYFENEYKHPGFYKYDSEHGDYEIDDVIYWAEGIEYEMPDELNN